MKELKEVSVAVRELAVCPHCDVAMQVQKTVLRRGRTLAHGCFEVHETILICSSGCRQDGKPVTARSTQLAQLLVPRGTVGYDVMVYVGCQRFVHFRQREEIREQLEKQYGIILSTGEISSLVRRFVVYLAKLHWQSAPALRAALEGDGGWTLHVDATGEDGRGTVISILAGWRGWVLEACKAPTERAEFVLPGMLRVAEAFGAPQAIVRDMGRAMTEAANEFVKSQQHPISICVCHQHFLTDVGKDLLAKRHKQLSDTFSQLKLQPKLRLFARQLGNRLGESIVDGREAAARWLLPNSPPPIPGGVAGITVVRAFAQWVLDHEADCHGQKFPYALPWHNLHSRCLVVSTALAKFLATPPHDVRVRKALEKLKRILDPVQQHPSLLLVGEALHKRNDLFNRLRGALRLFKDGEKDSVQKLNDIDSALERLTVDLKAERPQRGPATDMREAIDIILAHLKRHGPYLSGRIIITPKGKVLLVARTNNIEENEFHTLKHGERRRSGRKKLTQDLEVMPPAALLAGNLRHPDYVSLVCGSLDRLPQTFAQLDAGDRSVSIAARPSQDMPKTETASLSSADKQFIRQTLFESRILTAAQLQ